jgi:amidase
VNDLVRLTARQAVAALAKGDVTPLELIDAALERIAETDGAVNALPTLAPERARAHAAKLMAGGTPQDPPRGYLHGLPIAVKDLKDVAGVRSTKGSPIFADHVPERSDIIVENLEAKGAIVLAKSNTPEFGAGANTFNEVFGKTRNPWDTRFTCGGSSGGAAVSLATGQVWLATGSDTGGSLRVPASFCSIVGMRTTPGRVPSGPRALPFAVLSVEGPMGRNVGDVALFLDAEAGQHPEDPLSFPPPAQPYTQVVDEPRKPTRVAYTPDLGIAPMDAEVRAICASAARHFEAMGVGVEEDCIDLHDAEPIFQTLRAAQFAAVYKRHIEEHRDLVKPEIIANTEAGLALSADDVNRAELARGALYQRTVSFFERYDLLVSPAVLVPPFDVDQRYVTEAGGVTFDTYVGWLVMSFALTLTTCPAISIPCGFTEAGLPVGLQIMAPRADEASLLSAAALLEESLGIAAKLPIDPIVRH